MIQQCLIFWTRFKGIFTEAVKTVTDVIIPSSVLEMETPKDTEVEQPAQRKGSLPKFLEALMYLQYQKEKHKHQRERCSYIYSYLF